MEFENLKDKLDYLYFKFANEEFIKADPIQFVYKFEERSDKEIAGFVASILAQGKRENLIPKISQVLFQIMRGEPYNYIKNFDIEKERGNIQSFRYFGYHLITGEDLGFIFLHLSSIIRKYGSIGELIYEVSKKNSHSKSVREILIDFVSEFFSGVHSKIPRKISALVPSPANGSACKRLNMFLRWMVRKDRVDVGLWHQIVPTSKLIIPLDFHVAKISRELNLTQRKQNDWITAEEITEKLKMFDSEDPVKYDIALFGLGIERKKFKNRENDI